MGTVQISTRKSACRQRLSVMASAFLGTNPADEPITCGLPVIQQERVFGIGSSNGTWLRGPWDEETRENSNLLEIEMSNVIRKVCRSRRDIVEQLAARVVPQASFMRKGEKV